MPCSWRSLFSCGDTKSRKQLKDTPLQPVETSLKLLSAGVEPIVDIIAVHGLGGDNEKSWTTASGVNWLRDFVPGDLPSARVYTWGHNATNQDVDSQAPSMDSVSEKLVMDLCEERQKTSTDNRPIILIAHSLGGTIVKSALLYSDSCQNEPSTEHFTIRKCTYGIFFMGTPELDNRLIGLETYINHHATEAEKQTGSYKEAHWLVTKLRQYAMISEDYHTVYAYEKLKTPISPTPSSPGRVLQVSPRTQLPPINTYMIWIDADHVNMVKYESSDDLAYLEIRDYLRNMARDAVEGTGLNMNNNQEAEAGLGLSVE